MLSPKTFLKLLFTHYLILWSSFLHLLHLADDSFFIIVLYVILDLIFFFPFDSPLNIHLRDWTTANTVILQSLKPQAISIIEFVKLNISGTSGKSQSNTVSYLLNNIIYFDFIFHSTCSIHHLWFFLCFIMKKGRKYKIE